MTVNDVSTTSSRRTFLRELFLAGPFLCCGSAPLWARSAGAAPCFRQAGPHKFEDDSHFSYVEVFDFAYRISFIPLLNALADEMGRGKFVELLKSLTPDLSLRARDRWGELLTGVFWTHTLTRDIIEETDQVLRYRVRECLWAKTWREAGAGDIGYALFCFPDFARAQVMHRKLIRTKTLMQGDDVCDFHFELTEKVQAPVRGL